MKYLLAGMESKERVDLLIGFTSLRSKTMIKAIYVHLVDGFNESRAAAKCMVEQTNLNRL